MGLREELQADLAEAFSSDDELGQAYARFTAIRQAPDGEYVPGSGQSGGTTITYGGQYWRGKWSFTELQTLNIDAQDIKIGMLANATEQKPEVDDRLTLADGTVTRVTQVSKDPVEATYTVMLRVN